MRFCACWLKTIREIKRIDIGTFGAIARLSRHTCAIRVNPRFLGVGIKFVDSVIS